MVHNRNCGRREEDLIDVDTLRGIKYVSTIRLGNGANKVTSESINSISTVEGAAGVDIRGS